MFIIILKYIKSLTKVEKYLNEHIDFLNKNYADEKFICSGRQNPRVGGVIICKAKGKDEVNEIIKCDPFYREKVAEYEIIQFTPTKYADGFERFIDFR